MQGQTSNPWTLPPLSWLAEGVREDDAVHKMQAAYEHAGVISFSAADSIERSARRVNSIKGTISPFAA